MLNSKSNFNDHLEFNGYPAQGSDIQNAINECYRISWTGSKVNSWYTRYLNQTKMRQNLLLE